MNRTILLLFCGGVLAGFAAWGKGGSHAGSAHAAVSPSHSSNSSSYATSSGSHGASRGKAASHGVSPRRSPSHLSSSASSGSVKRDFHGRIARSEAAKRSFEKTHPCPATGRSGGSCPGYVVDHIKPLACGGADAPSNMQWQTEAEGKAKDAWERKGCR